MTEKLMLSEEDELLEMLKLGNADQLDGLDGLDGLENNLSPVNTGSLKTIDVLLANLSEEEIDVVDKYFGLSGGVPYTAEEIGDSLGLTEIEVGEIIGQALRRLRAAD